MLRNLVVGLIIVLGAAVILLAKPSSSQTPLVAPAVPTDRKGTHSPAAKDSIQARPAARQAIATKAANVRTTKRLQSKANKVASAPLHRLRVTSKFGPRIHPILKRKKFHGGVDLAAKMDDHVKSISQGVVIHAGRKGALGKAVYVSHPKLKITSIYGHLNKVAVRKGQKVSPGQVIGYAGTTGRSTGVHLHLTLKDQRTGRPIEPLAYLAKLGASHEGQTTIAMTSHEQPRRIAAPPNVVTLAQSTTGAAKPAPVDGQRNVVSTRLRNNIRTQSTERAVIADSATVPQTQQEQSTTAHVKLAELEAAIKKADQLKQWFAEGIASKNDFLNAQSKVDALRDSIEANKT